VRSGLSLALLIVCAVWLAGCGDRSSGSTQTPARSTPSTAADTPTPAATASPLAPRSVTISAAGDVSLARQLVERMAASGADYPYELIRHLLSGDIAIANLEGALTERGEPWPKGYNFRTPPRFAVGLRNAGFDLVSLANNHAMDYGAIGLVDTLQALDDAGVAYVGAGENRESAWAWQTLEANGLRIAFIGCALTPTEGGGFRIHAWAAGADTPGMAICDDPALATTIEGARRANDFVIVIVHAGTEYSNVPDATQRRIADAALAAGADAYIGHHAHVVQPVEQRGNRLIAWGLGNFIFDLDNVDLANIPQPRVSLVLNITFTEGAGVTAWEAVPVTLDDAEDRPRPATPEEAGVLQELVMP